MLAERAADVGAAAGEGHLDDLGAQLARLVLGAS